MFGVGAPADGERHAPSETITHDKETKLRFNDFLLERGVHILDVSPAFGCSFSTQLIRPIGAEGLSRRPPAGPCRLFLGFRLAAR